ncbi:hypothetical protein T265_06632 [Opisthorchis viverrini]|uniref:Uncharacterized protein n=1 Tax=Opisthorchis viverrini TaxID=6198 RepID=A0A074ZFJ9_OPIVI|nr:hypothetical protein T265_06632 [Opisthorchis viverrini]KER26056.1 hypothetical protein T265_06632 [Opisthorchis viverrini]
MRHENCLDEIRPVNHINLASPFTISHASTRSINISTQGRSVGWAMVSLPLAWDTHDVRHMTNGLAARRFLARKERPSEDQEDFITCTWVQATGRT